MKKLIFVLLSLVSFSAFGAAGIVNTGANVTLSVTSDGATPFTYQWKKGGADILGATAATYVITGAKATDTGVYTVQVTNQWGSVLSDNATLTVNAPAPVPQPPTKATTLMNVTKL